MSPRPAKDPAWRILRDQPGARWDEDRNLIKIGMQVAKGQCQVHPTRWRCTNPATQVIKEGLNTLVAVCDACRLKAYGPTPAEKTAATKAAKALQATLPGVATKPVKPQY